MEKLKHLIKMEDMGKRDDIEALFELSKAIKENPEKFRNQFAGTGKRIATLFYEPSTRTRSGFHAAAHELGLGVIDETAESSSCLKGESLEDTIRTFEGYCDGIVLRHEDTKAGNRATAVASVPIISAGCGKGEHPPQALLEGFALNEKKGKIDGLGVAFEGDLKNSRTAHSLIKLLSLYKDITIHCSSVPGLELPKEYVKLMEERGTSFSQCSPQDIPRDVDAIYMTRVKQELLKNKKHDTQRYFMDQKRLDTFSKDTLLMHPLPRNAEIPSSVDKDPRAVYFKVARDGVPTKQAILMATLQDELSL